jgi:hypothetical protein
MHKPITDASLSIVREVVSIGSTPIALPLNVVKEMIARIDIQGKKIRAYKTLVDCHDNYLCEVDQTSAVSQRLLCLEKARQELNKI